jgi:ribonuclease HII
MYVLESFYKAGVQEAGLDEAGRGCLAGPVYAAAVILPSDYHHSLLNDSKKLTHKQRLVIREEIKKNALAYAVAAIDNTKIDEINILNASILAMHHALDQLTTKPGHIIVDGNRFKVYKDIEHQCIIKGDSKYFSIAAASVLAKTYRDEFMVKIAREYPQYGWTENKGYPTKKHRQAIMQHGITVYHRKSFNLLDNQLTFDFTGK